MAETNNPITYPRPAKSFDTRYGWRACVEIAKNQYEYFGNFPDELSADDAARVRCEGERIAEENERANASEAD